MIPVAGSAYTYAYATLGELFAWIIGWDLVLEYARGVEHGRARLVALLPVVPRALRHHAAGAWISNPIDFDPATARGC